MAQINGRHITQNITYTGRGTIRAVSPDYVVDISPGLIRVDDKNNLDFWLEIQLEPEEVAILTQTNTNRQKRD